MQINQENDKRNRLVLEVKKSIIIKTKPKEYSQKTYSSQNSKFSKFSDLHYID